MYIHIYEHYIDIQRIHCETVGYIPVISRETILRETFFSLVFIKLEVEVEDALEYRDFCGIRGLYFYKYL